MGSACSKKQVEESRSKFYDELPSDLEVEFEVRGIVAHCDDSNLIIKKVKHRSSGTLYLADEYDIRPDIILQECELLGKFYKVVDHPNLPNVEVVFKNDASSEMETITFIRSYCDGGELFDRIVQKNAIAENHAARYTKQMLEAVGHLHANGIVHRNLKPEIIYFQDKHYSDLVIHPSSFFTEPGTETEGLKQPCGTPGYVSPELLGGKYGKATDLWSIGVIVYIMLCGYPPFSDNSNEELYRMIKTERHSFDSQNWDHVSSTAKDFINKLLKKNPAKRMTCEEALEHPWMKKFEK